MSTDVEARRKRGTIRRSLTNIAKKVTEIEALDDKVEASRRAQRLSKRITELDGEFKTIQYQIMSAIADSDRATITAEQTTLDKHDDELDDLSVRLQALMEDEAHDDTREERSISRTLSSLKDSLSRITDGLRALTPADGTEDETMPDELLVQQYQEELSDFKTELTDCRNRLCRLDLHSDNELCTQYSELKASHFDACHSVKKILSSLATPTGNDAAQGLKVPKLEAPTFDGDLLNWTHFWEQFRVSIDQRANLSNAEKLVYLQQSLKGGTAKSVIQGLSSTGEHYEKAIECLKARYDRPRQIHQSHVKVIMEITPLKHGSGKELRRLHDVLQQHLRALDAADCVPLSQFVTSIIQLKLDQDTLFEWQKHTQSTNEVPHYQDMLEFIDLRARASESTIKRTSATSKSEHRAVVNAASVSDTPNPTCVLCRSEKHPLYHCSKFKGMSYQERLTTIREHRLCMNCLKRGHFLRECKSVHHCKHCQKPHHTLLHMDSSHTTTPDTIVSSNLSAGTVHDNLLMTCQIWVVAPDGSKVKARALLDPASSSSFISERLVQGMGLPRSRTSVTVSGVAGLCSSSPLRSVANVIISPIHSTRCISLSAVVVPRVTADLPLNPVKIQHSWTHIDNLSLADPQFDTPGRIDLLLGVEIYTEVLLNGRRSGPVGSPTAFQTIFGWVLAGRTQSEPTSSCVISHHVSTEISGDDILHKFWEIEEPPRKETPLSMEDQSVMNHFKQSYRINQGRFVVPLARRSDSNPLGESRSQAVRRFMNLERSLKKKGQFEQLDKVVVEYFELGHAEPVPVTDLLNPQGDVFYLPIHAVTKTSSTTTKLRAVFDASAKSSSGASLNDQLLVGPTVHSPLIDVLIRFRQFRIAITTDISKMYRAIDLDPKDRDLHRFVWRSNISDCIHDYRMTRITFGVSASSFIANMCVKENALIHSHQFPLAAKAVNESFYVDDGLTGTNDELTAVKLQKEMDELFKLGGFTLHKWNSNSQIVLNNIPPEMRDNNNAHQISDIRESTKTLGLEWRTRSDCFHLTISDSPFSSGVHTKRTMVSDVARVFDVLGWFSPAVISVKILLQRLWEQGIGWDDPVPSPINDSWKRWKSELPCLSGISMPRCYYPKEVQIVKRELHGFSDASENAYAAVVYLRMVDVKDQVHVILVAAKTKVAPLKRLTIPRLELCGALLLSKLIGHVKEVLGMSMEQIVTWTDSTVVLHWLTGSPRRFKTFVGNRVSQIIDQVPVDRWRHVAGKDNPADCASRGLYPSELVGYRLWWDGPSWLKLPREEWPERILHSTHEDTSEVEEVTLSHNTAATDSTSPVNVDRFSSFERLQRTISWLFRFARNCRLQQPERNLLPYVTVSELQQAERYLCKMIQRDCFSADIKNLELKRPLLKGNCLLPLSPFVDTDGILRVGGRQRYSNASYSKIHPVVLHSKHVITKLMIRSEHKRLLHGGPTMMMASLSRRYYIIRIRQATRSVTRQCTTCRRWSVKPQPPVMGQLPIERLTPGPIFDKTGLDYAGPILIKYGHVRKPVIVKAYVCVFVSLTVKAVHLEAVSDLTSEAFIACLRRFIARRGYPSLLWSDHGTNFVGAQREIKELLVFLEKQSTQRIVSEFCSAHNIEWRFIPQRSPHFGGIWEAAVKSFKGHLRRVVGDVKLTYEEASTVLAQIECCLNSRPLVPIGNSDDLEVLTPGHFLIGQPLVALPDPAITYQSSSSLLKRWHLCQNVVRHFWQRWYHEYLSTLQSNYKWKSPVRDMSVGDVVMLNEEEMIPTKWPIARVVKVYPGKDGVVRVVDIKTAKGSVYRRPVHKLARLIDE